MIRILHIVSSLNINAGVMSVIMNYYRRIDRSRIQFDFLYMEETEADHKKEITELGGRTFLVPYPTFRIKDQKRLRSFFEEHRNEYIAVHCHPIWAAEIVSREAKRSGIKHIIQHSHSTKFAETKKSEIRNRLLVKFIGAFATDYIACSPEAAYLFGKRKVATGKVMILPNAINIDLYTFSQELRKTIRSEFECSENTILFGNIGRLSRPKNQLFVLEIFKEIHADIPDSKLLIVGEGGLREEIERKIAAYGLTDSVTLTGKRRDIKAILSGLDVFLMPSLFEGSPVSALEARASGLPCLLSDTITNSVEMDGISFISLKQNATSWAKQAIEYYYSRLEFDRSNYSELIRKGFDITKTTEQLQNFYFNL